MDKKEVKTTEKGLLVAKNNTSIDDGSPTKALAFNRKKREFKAFIKLVREGKFTTGLLTAKMLKVDYTTISAWLQTPQVKQAMNEEVNQYVESIQVSKDWKAHAYLLDKITPSEEKQSNQQNIIIVNNDKEFKIGVK